MSSILLSLGFYYGTLHYPNNGESNGKENGKLNGSWDYIGAMLYYSSRIFTWGYYGTHYRVRLHPPFGL